MQHPIFGRTMRYKRLDLALSLISCVVWSCLAGCGSSKKSATPAPVQVSAINSYFAMTTESPTTSAGGLSLGYTFTLDHTASIFDQEDISGGSPIPISRGSFKSSNGFIGSALNPYNGVSVASPEVGNWLLEQQGVMGFAYISAPNATGLDGNVSGPQGQADTSQNLIPFISNASCPNVAGKHTYQFLTFPGTTGQNAWDFQTDAAYGTVQVATLQSGTVDNLSGITQYLLPGGQVSPGTAVTLNPGPTDMSGSCGLSAAGSLMSFSYNDILGVPHYAELNLASGFLLESDTGVGSENQGVSNILGAGYGAIGLQQPSAAVGATTLAGGNFKGFIHASDSYTSTASFSGAATSSGACTSFAKSIKSLPSRPSANAIYGGEYAGNDPSVSKTANCDMAIDLGSEDSKNNGLFPDATVYIGSAFPLNNSGIGTGPGTSYSIPAVAIVGQINGQNAVFLLAEDTVAGLGHSVGIYLLHSQ